jgi:hypothetical protein
MARVYTTCFVFVRLGEKSTNQHNEKCASSVLSSTASSVLLSAVIESGSIKLLILYLTDKSSQNTDSIITLGVGIAMQPPRETFPAHLLHGPPLWRQRRGQRHWRRRSAAAQSPASKPAARPGPHVDRRWRPISPHGERRHRS